MPSRKNCLLLIGHFTPPVHGMAVAMDALGELMATRGTVIRIRTVPGPTRSRQVHHLRRLPVVILALAKMFLFRRKSRSAVLSVDAGFGMVYTIMLMLAARCAQYKVTLQHHSYAYISQRSVLMSGLVALGGRSTAHMFTCDAMREGFRRRYARLSASEIVSVAYALSLPPAQKRGVKAPKQRLTLGHMSNLSVEKGLDEVVDIAQEATRRGLADKLVLAGPVTDHRAEKVLRQSRSTATVEERGYVSGSGKERFFADIDVFLFLSRYRNESFGLVVWEAMLRGVPVIAYRAGCLTQAAVGSGGVVLEMRGGAESGVMKQLAAWLEHPDQLARAREESVRVAIRERQRAISGALAVATRLFRQAPNE